jgi:hypothetical protein
MRSLRSVVVASRRLVVLGRSNRAEMKASEIRQQANPEAVRQRGEEVVGIPELELELLPKPTG